MKKIVEHLEKSNLVEPTHSNWAARTYLLKKDRSHRLLVDYRGLNNQIEKTSWPLPEISDVIDWLDGDMLFSINDLISGYFEMALDKDSQILTTFITSMGLYEWKRLPMGLASGPEAFQNLMELILSGLLYEAALVYLDDIITFGKTFEEHLERFELIPCQLKEAWLKLRGSKCRFFWNKLLFLWDIVCRTTAWKLIRKRKTRCFINWDRGRIDTKIARHRSSYCVRQQNTEWRTTKLLRNQKETRNYKLSYISSIVSGTICWDKNS